MSEQQTNYQLKCITYELILAATSLINFIELCLYMASFRWFHEGALLLIIPHYIVYLCIRTKYGN